jgi:hypothetical protein
MSTLYQHDVEEGTVLLATKKEEVVHNQPENSALKKMLLVVVLALVGFAAYSAGQAQEHATNFSGGFGMGR